MIFWRSSTDQGKRKKEKGRAKDLLPFAFSLLPCNNGQATWNAQAPGRQQGRFKVKVKRKKEEGERQSKNVQRLPMVLIPFSFYLFSLRRLRIGASFLHERLNALGE
jgi:hypothetical protein